MLVSQSLSSKGSICHIASSWVAYKLTAISCFPVAEIVTSLIGLTFLPVACFSRRLHSNRSRCSLLKVARPERLRDKMPVGPGLSPSSCSKVYPRDYSVWALPWGLKLGWLFLSAGGPIELCVIASGRPRSWPVCRNEFPSGHSPASGVGGHHFGCHVDGPLNLPRDRLSGDARNSRSQRSRNSLPYTRPAGVRPVVSWVDALEARRKMCSLASSAFSVKI
jgi:hypothetical protein